jgi:hypothetical protein
VRLVVMVLGTLRKYLDNSLMLTNNTTDKNVNKE